MNGNFISYFLIPGEQTLKLLSNERKRQLVDNLLYTHSKEILLR